MMPVAIFPLFYWTEDRRQVTEVASMLLLTKSYNALVSLLFTSRKVDIH
ncbi:hypothetical protein J2X69_002249 [Algoriphagus sp. 4150]|nr:hypothetical protein [Algoriphagus sp. 4150]